MASLPIGIVVELASNPKVHDAVVKAFESFSRIFKSQSNAQAAIDLKPVPAEQKILIDRLSAIDQKLVNMPSDTEMAMAFSLLQSELRAGQKRLWLILVPLFAVNFMLLAFIIFQH